MRISDVVSLAAGAMADRKFRAALTILGIVIGPATIVALVAATQGLSNASSAQFQKLGATTIFVSSSFNLTQADLNEIQGLPGVASVVPYDQLSGTVNVAGTQEGVTIIATDISKLESVLPSLSLQSGSIPPSSDITGAILGASVAHPDISNAKNLTVDDELAVNQIQSESSSFSAVGGGVFFRQSVGGGPSGTSQSENRTFIVSGIYNPFGQGIQINPDSTIFVPIATAQSITHVYTYASVLVKATSSKLVSEVSTEITNLFGSSKITAGTVISLLSISQSVSQGISTLLETVAGISVLVAFIGIMTTMFTSVIERTKEIGILKALGASGRHIMLTFLSEAALTGFVGGVVGAAAGSLLSFLVVILLQGSGGGSPGISGGPPGQLGSSSTTLTITPAITPELIFAAVLLATIVGMLAGLFPSWRASKMPPVEALRSV